MSWLLTDCCTLIRQGRALRAVGTAHPRGLGHSRAVETLSRWPLTLGHSGSLLPDRLDGGLRALDSRIDHLDYDSVGKARGVHQRLACHLGV